MDIRKHVQRGFSLLELMIVVAIVGIISTIALPMYQEHIAKAKLMEGYYFLESVRLDVNQYYDKKRRVSDLDASTFDDKLDIVAPSSSSVIGTYGVESWQGHDIAIWFSTKSNADLPSSLQGVRPFVLFADINEQNKLVWECSNDFSGNNVPDAYIPSQCK